MTDTYYDKPYTVLLYNDDVRHYQTTTVGPGGTLYCCNYNEFARAVDEIWFAPHEWLRVTKRERY